MASASPFLASSRFSSSVANANTNNFNGKTSLRFPHDAKKRSFASFARVGKKNHAMMLSRGGNSALVNRLRREVRLNNAKRVSAHRFCLRGSSSRWKNHLKINFSLSLTEQARREHSQNRAIADDTVGFTSGNSSNNEISGASSSAETQSRLVTEILENVDDGGE